MSRGRQARADPMRIITYLGLKTLLLSATASVLAAWFAWLILPPAPRVAIPAKDRHGRLAFSNDCRFFAYAEGEPTDKRHWKGELRVWDTRDPHLLFAVEYSELHPPATDGGYSLAFTTEGDKLVTYSWGEAK